MARGRAERIEVEHAPTYYGTLTATLESRVAAGEIRADIRMPSVVPPTSLLVRLRHPDRARMKSVTVNGQPWTDFQADAEWVRIPSPRAERYEIVVRY